jgi:hypothetical protein
VLGGDKGKDTFTVVERSANVLSLLFVHGGVLASELITVVNSSHAALNGMLLDTLCVCVCVCVWSPSSYYY